MCFLNIRMPKSRPCPAGVGAWKQVTKVFRTHPGRLREIQFCTAAGRRETLRTTPGHPFYVVDSGNWEPAEQVNPGEQEQLADGSTAVVTESQARGGRNSCL